MVVTTLVTADEPLIVFVVVVVALPLPEGHWKSLGMPSRVVVMVVVVEFPLCVIVTTGAGGRGIFAVANAIADTENERRAIINMSERRMILMAEPLALCRFLHPTLLSAEKKGRIKAVLQPLYHPSSIFCLPI